jgi:hypothetical protein
VPQVTESRPLAVLESDTPPTSGRLRVQVITPGWGSSGYYPAPVLEAAGNAAVFPAGTQMYLDHPSWSEAQDRPERSVRDLAAVLTAPASWDDQLQALVAEAQVFAPYRDMLTDPGLAQAIGVSIRANAVVEQGEAEGREGTIVSELVEGVSVDFVTQAGRGGRILSVLESARPQRVVERAVAAGVQEATANDTQAALAAALTVRLGGSESYAWVRDFDDTTVWFELESPTLTGLFAMTYQLADTGGVTFTGDPQQVTARTTYVPVNPAGSTQESQGGMMAQVDDARLRSLEESAGRVQALEAERDAATQRANTAESQLAQIRIRDAARPLATAVAAESATLPAGWQADVVEAALTRVPVTEAGQLDEAALRTTVETERTRQETRLAEALEAAGAGRVRGNGQRQAQETGGGGFDLDAAVMGRYVKTGA